MPTQLIRIQHIHLHIYSSYQNWLIQVDTYANKHTDAHKCCSVFCPLNQFMHMFSCFFPSQPNHWPCLISSANSFKAFHNATHNLDNNFSWEITMLSPNDNLLYQFLWKPHFSPSGMCSWRKMLIILPALVNLIALHWRKLKMVCSYSLDLRIKKKSKNSYLESVKWNSQHYWLLTFGKDKNSDGNNTL